jgi:hypothetical protein
LDSSSGSVAGGAALQSPAEEQLTWLRSVLCTSPQTPTDHCTRGEREQALVVSEDPTYSYASQFGNATASDGTQLETLLLAYHANLVVSGRLGWNGRYWATAPGVHEPCPGGDYMTDAQAPRAGVQSCQQLGAADPASAALSRSLGGLGAPAAPDPTQTATQAAGVNATGVLPFVVAASAGGRFGPDGQASGSAAQGFWHGYTVVRLDASGDPRATIVEQRPVFDWVSIRGQTHVLRPGQHVTLHGFGREPVGTDAPISYDDIDGPAITHRYDLVQADPQRPWLPRSHCRHDRPPVGRRARRPRCPRARLCDRGPLRWG